jgi:hypothetical protein
MMKLNRRQTLPSCVDFSSQFKNERSTGNSATPVHLKGRRRCLHFTKTGRRSAPPVQVEALAQEIHQPVANVDRVQGARLKPNAGSGHLALLCSRRAQKLLGKRAA